jgi:hypothetical protein
MSTIVRDLGASILRSVVASVVGGFVAWLAKNAGIVIDANTSAGLVQAFTVAVIAAYYIVVRVLETKSPIFGWLLGLAKLPNYAAPTNTVPDVPSDTVPVKE